MQTIQEAAAEFLARKRIAVTGYSRHPQSHAGNYVFQRLKECGYDVFPVNPNADVIEGVACYHDLRSIPGGVEAVVIGTGPDHAEETMRECAALGIRHVWMHRSFGKGSVSKGAAEYGREQGIHVIAGGCPLMFAPVSDPGHQFMRVLCRMTGNLPRSV